MDADMVSSTSPLRQMIRSWDSIRQVYHVGRMLSDPTFNSLEKISSGIIG